MSGVDKRVEHKWFFPLSCLSWGSPKGAFFLQKRFFGPRRAAVTEPWRLEQTRHATMLCVLCGGILGQWSRLLSCINDAHKRALAWNNALFDYRPIMCSWAVSRALSPPHPTPQPPSVLAFHSQCYVAIAQGRASSACHEVHTCIYIYGDRFIYVCVLYYIFICPTLRFLSRRMVKLYEPLREIRRPHFPNQVGQVPAKLSHERKQLKDLD